MGPKILIVEDNEMQRNNLRNFIKEIDTQAEIHGAADGRTALTLLDSAYDIILLDISLGDIDGLTIGKKLRECNRSCPIIFVTSYPDYLPDALHTVHCYDYLVKPVKKEAFQQLIKPLLDINQPNCASQPTLTLETVDGDTAVIPLPSIFFIEVQDHQILIHTDNGVATVRSSLTAIERTLPQDSFYRCHSSYVVNVKRVSSVRSSTDYSDNVWFEGYQHPAHASARRRRELRRLLRCRHQD